MSSCQLPLVKQKRLLGTYPAIWNPWDRFENVELTEIMRQKDDLTYAKCLYQIPTQVPVTREHHIDYLLRSNANKRP